MTDGVVAVRALLSPAALRNSLEPHRLFTVPQYIIQYTPYGPPRERLTIALNLARSPAAHDTHGKPLRAPAVCPKPIHECDQILSVLRDLRQTLTQLERTHLRRIRSALVKSQAMASQEEGDETKGEKTFLDTQPAFGTQMVHRLETPAKAQTEPADSGKRVVLLGLLNRQKTHHQNSELASISGKSNSSQGLSIDPQTARPNGRSADSPPAQTGISHHSPTHGKPVVALSAGGFTKTSTSHTTDQNVIRPESVFQPARMPPPYHKSGTTGERASFVAPQETQQANGPSTNAYNSESGPSLPQLDLDVHDDPVPEWLRDSCYKNNCGRVIDTQVKLLSSWQKNRAGMNDRFPDANIPIDVLKALKSFEIDTASSEAASSDSEPSDEEGSAISDADPSSEESGEPWSTSPVRESPKRRFRHSPSLPPDSSLASKNTASQTASGTVEPSQGNQRAVVVEPATEKNIPDIPSSPPETRPSSTPAVPFSSNLAIPIDDDLDMEMELDIPRGLDAGHAAQQGHPSSSVQRTDCIVQVKETPFSKGKDTGIISTVGVPPQIQQQTSSGTSKDSSSTSIIFSTYNERSFQKDAVPSVRRPSSKPYTGSLSYDGHRDFTESGDDHHSYSANDTRTGHGENEDVRMQDVQDEVLRSPVLSSPQSEHQRQRSPVSAGTSPPTIRLKDEVVLAKRKMEASPAKNGRRPSKRRDVKLVKLRSSSPKRDSAAELLQEKEEHLRLFTERARTQSIPSILSDDDVAPVAHTKQLPVQREASIGVEDTPAGAPRASQLLQHTHKQASRLNASKEQKVLREKMPMKHAKSFGLGELAGRPTTPILQEDVDMTDGSTDVENSDVQITDVATASVGAEADKVVVEETALQEGKNRTDEAGVDHDTPNLVQGISSQRSTAPLTKNMALMAVRSEKPPTGTPAVDQITIFELFKHTYPEYKGDARHFLGQCKSMDKLDVQDKMVPKWQWDDFIIRNRTDYRDYANQCLDNGEDAEPYYRFYKDNIQNTLYTKGIMESRKTLLAAIAQLEGKATGNGTTSFGASSPAPSVHMPKPTKPNVPSPAAVRPKTTFGRMAAADHAMTQQGSPSSSAQKKKRQSLPSAFDKRPGQKPSMVESPSGRPRQSLPGSSSAGPSSLAPRSSHAKQEGPLSKPNSASTRPASLRRSSSGPRDPREPTGDPYRDFIFAHSRITSLTGDARVRPPPPKSSAGEGEKKR